MTKRKYFDGEEIIDELSDMKDHGLFKVGLIYMEILEDENGNLEQVWCDRNQLPQLLDETGIKESDIIEVPLEHIVSYKEQS